MRVRVSRRTLITLKLKMITFKLRMITFKRVLFSVGLDERPGLEEDLAAQRTLSVPRRVLLSVGLDACQP